MPVATLARGSCVACPSEVAWGEPGFSESDGPDVMVGGGDDIHLASSSKSPDMETIERSDAMDIRNASGSWSQGGNGN